MRPPHDISSPHWRDPIAFPSVWDHSTTSDRSCIRLRRLHGRACAGVIAPIGARALHSFTSGGVPISVEWFAGGHRKAEPGPALLLLHGADGLTFGDGYRAAAHMLAASGYHVGFVHYLDRTGEHRVSYSTLRQGFSLWAETVRDGLSWLAEQADVDAGRLGIVGISLGAALGMEVAADDRRVRALVDYFGPVPEGLVARRPTLPPTLILHGAQDPIVPVRNARELEALLEATGTPHEIQVYQGQGHGFIGMAQFDSASRVSGFLDRHLKALEPVR
jgi:dienelactone hydrolase